MSRLQTLSHEFVELMPDDLNEGVIYVSMIHCTAIHKCCCGCGQEVVTPISPAKWQLGFDGDHVSLFPSVGNWSFPCKSHYWIRTGKVIWSRTWSAEEIEEGRASDRSLAEAHYDGKAEETAPTKRDDAHSFWQFTTGRPFGK
jgi:hypothetical protein